MTFSDAGSTPAASTKFSSLFFNHIFLLGIAPAMADTVDQAMIVSVKGAPIEVPGRVLDPGKYVLRFPDIEHNFVDISTAAGDQIGFYQVVPISRPVRKDSAQLVLANRKNSVPELKAFFYPGMKTGYKFLYPTAQVSPVVQARASNISPGR